MEPIVISRDPGSHELLRRCGVDFHRCFHCRCCGGGCPFIETMDHAPHAVIRLLQFGLIDEALASRTIWTCVSCNTCAMQCPMAIDIPALMDGLRQMALERNMVVAEPDVVAFHEAVLDSIARHGRTHKLEIMLRYKLKTRTFLQDWQVGLKMMAKRKLDLAPSRVKAIAAIKSLLNNRI
jgi:heterodisulfide reductase subunit C